MKCKHITNQLSAYIDDALTAGEKERVENHLASCPDCRQALASLQQTIETLQAVPRTPAPDDFLHQVNAKIDARQGRSLYRSFDQLRHRLLPVRIKLPMPMVAATAMAVLVLIIIRSPEMEKVSDTTLKKHRQIDALQTTSAPSELMEDSLPATAKAKKEAAATLESIPTQMPSETDSDMAAGSGPVMAGGSIGESRQRTAPAPAASRYARQHTLYEQVRPTGERNTPVVITLTLNQQPSSPAIKTTAPTRLSFGAEGTSADAVGAEGKASSWKQQDANNDAAEPKITSPLRSAERSSPPAEKVIMAEEEKDEMMPAESALEDEAALEIAAAPAVPNREEVIIQLTELTEGNGGKVIIITETANGQPATMTASIPAEAFGDFTEQLRQLGQVDVPATIPALERDEARVRVTIRLLAP